MGIINHLAHVHTVQLGLCLCC